MLRTWTWICLSSSEINSNHFLSQARTAGDHGATSLIIGFLVGNWLAVGLLCTTLFRLSVITNLAIISLLLNYYVIWHLLAFIYVFKRCTKQKIKLKIKYYRLKLIKFKKLYNITKINAVSYHVKNCLNMIITKAFIPVYLCLSCEISLYGVSVLFVTCRCSV